MLWAAVAAGAFWAPVDPLVPPATGGITTVDDVLKRLVMHARVLVVGAHPDDEDSNLLALVAGMGGEAAYFSLSRGEGGQNLIGPELGVGLGLIRSEELLGARRLEGNRQYFSRAYDFGYTRSLDETLARWPKEELLADAARVVRDFKPQVIVSIFPNGGGGTHGQHQVAGVVAHEIFELSGDAAFHPELSASGLDPWAPSALYRRAWRRGEEQAMPVTLDGVDPITGRGWGQLAAASRSMHRSQDMGRMQTLGGARTALVWVAGSGGANAEQLFAGIDTRLSSIADLLPAAESRAEARTRLEWVESEAARLRAALVPSRLAEMLPYLRALHDGLLQVERLALAIDAPAGRVVAALVTEKRALVEDAVLAAAGIAIDARADRERVVPGGEVEVALSLWNSADQEVQLVAAEIEGRRGWSSGRVALEEPATVSAGELAEWSRTIALAPDAEPSRPYFLANSRSGDLYDWSEAAVASRARAFAAPPLVARFTVEVAGLRVAASREVVYAFADQARGEVRRPLQAVPTVEVEVTPRLVLRPSSQPGPSRIEVEVRSNAARPLTGSVQVELPVGWEPIAPLPFEIADGGGGVAVEVAVDVPAAVPAGRYRLRVTAVLASGDRFAGSFPTTEYEHVRPRPRLEPSVVELELLDLVLPAVGPIAWVRGASDSVPAALAELGMAIELLDAAGVAAVDLGAYALVVIGSRAYETDAGLGRVNEKLLDFARAGGTLIVLYQQYQFSRGGFAPYAFEISRPHDRITDETAPVHLLVPEHPVFNHPNRLTSADWQDWVQERGLYFGGSWGSEFTPLLGFEDPGEAEKQGGLLVASLGAGSYVYTGLSFFREIPAGVPGAYRLLANLLALGETS